MKSAVDSINNFEKEYLFYANDGKHDILLIETRPWRAAIGLIESFILGWPFCSLNLNNATIIKQ